MSTGLHNLGPSGLLRPSSTVKVGPRILHHLGLMTQLGLNLRNVSDAATTQERTYAEATRLPRLDATVTPGHVVDLATNDGGIARQNTQTVKTPLLRHGRVEAALESLLLSHGEEIVAQLGRRRDTIVPLGNRIGSIRPLSSIGGRSGRRWRRDSGDRTRRITVLVIVATRRRLLHDQGRFELLFFLPLRLQGRLLDCVSSRLVRHHHIGATKTARHQRHDVTRPDHLLLTLLKLTLGPLAPATIRIRIDNAYLFDLLPKLLDNARVPNSGGVEDKLTLRTTNVVLLGSDRKLFATTKSSLVIVNESNVRRILEVISAERGLILSTGRNKLKVLAEAENVFDSRAGSRLILNEPYYELAKPRSRRRGHTGARRIGKWINGGDSVGTQGKEAFVGRRGGRLKSINTIAAATETTPSSRSCWRARRRIDDDARMTLARAGRRLSLGLGNTTCECQRRYSEESTYVPRVTGRFLGDEALPCGDERSDGRTIVKKLKRRAGFEDD